MHKAEFVLENEDHKMPRDSKRSFNPSQISRPSVKRICRLVGLQNEIKQSETINKYLDLTRKLNSYQRNWKPEERPKPCRERI